MENAETRITMRATANEKNELQHAAHVAGFRNLSSFMMTIALREARKILREEEQQQNNQTITLSGVDAELLVDLLEHTEKPNDKLRELLKESRKG